MEVARAEVQRDDRQELTAPVLGATGSEVAMAFSCPGRLFETAIGGGECELGDHCHARFLRHFWPAYRAAHAGRITHQPPS
jgi:hypothetical protein